MRCVCYVGLVMMFACFSYCRVVVLFLLILGVCFCGLLVVVFLCLLCLL